MGYGLGNAVPFFSYTNFTLVKDSHVSVIYIGMKDQSVSFEASLEVPLVWTFHALLKQNLYGKRKSSEALVVYRHILDIRPSGFFTGRSQECAL